MKPDPEFSSSEDAAWDDFFRTYQPVPLPDDFASCVLGEAVPQRGRRPLIIGLAMVLLLGSIGMLLASLFATTPALSGLASPPASWASAIAHILQVWETISDTLRLPADCFVPVWSVLQRSAAYGGGLLLSAAFLLGLLVLLHVRSLHPITKP